MPLPFILAGAALVAGAWGVKKGADARSDYKTAKDINRRAQRIYDDAKEELEIARENTHESVEELGKTKFSIFEHSMFPFFEAFKKIKMVSFEGYTDDIFDGSSVEVDENFKKIEHSVFEMQEIIGGGVTSLGAGGLAGLATYGGVGVLGTASTGTAIGSLSGVAATNATLAWLGGGSLASGGLGIAGGTAVLGGIVAGPVLAVGGMMLASKAEEAKEKSYANQEMAELAAEEMGLAKVSALGIQERFDEMNAVLIQLDQTFSPYLESLQTLVVEEPKRLHQYKLQTAEKLNGVVELVQQGVFRYEISRKGFVNKIRTLLGFNKTQKQLYASVKSLKELILGIKIHEVLNLPDSPSDKAKVDEIKDWCIALSASLESAARVFDDNVYFVHMSEENQKGLHMIFSLANTLSNLLNTQLLTEDGCLTDASQLQIEKANVSLELMQRASSYQ